MYVCMCINIFLCPYSFNVALRPQRPNGLLGPRSPGRPPRLSTQLLPSLCLYTCIHVHVRVCGVGVEVV